MKYYEVTNHDGSPIGKFQTNFKPRALAEAVSRERKGIVAAVYVVRPGRQPEHIEVR